MSHRISQVRAAITVSKFSLISTLKSPTAVVFSLLFPLIFIVVFGAMVGNKGPQVMSVAITANSDTSSPVYKALQKVPLIKLETNPSAEWQADALKRGKVGGILYIANDSTIIPHYTVHLNTSTASQDKGLLEMLINETIRRINEQAFSGNMSIASVTATKSPGRLYRSIDFVLPGQLGFSLLMAGVFGSSYILFNLRQGLVLKRMRVTPVRRRSIITGEMLSRLFFHIISFSIMVGLGYYAFHFTLINGFATFTEMLCFSLLGLIVFMGIGFIISGLVQNENAISPIANTLVLPQILLCGLFFSIESYPHWLQGFCHLLPLTYFVEGLRKIAFDGKHIWELHTQLIGLLVWICIITPLSVKTFKWE